MAATITRWALCDDNGAELADVTNAAGKHIVFKRNGYHEAQLTIGHRDAAASLLWASLLATGIPTLKVYRNEPSGVPVFNGSLTPFTETYDANGGQLNLIFRSAFAQLMGFGPGSGPPLLEGLSYVSAEQTAIANDLVTLAITTWALPMSAPTVTTTSTGRTITLVAGTTIGQAILTLANVSGGFEFLDVPTATSGLLGHLDIRGTIGSDKVNALFEYGPSTLRNVSAMQRTVSMPVNTALLLGANEVVIGDDNPTSVAKYGNLIASESRPEITDTGLLTARAGQLLRSVPSRVISFTADPGLPSTPKPFDDYYVGDTVRFRAIDGSLNEAGVSSLPVPVRVNSFDWVIDENGYEAAAIADPQTDDEQAAIQSALAMELVS